MSANVEIWFPIEKDKDGYPKTRDWEGLWCEPLERGFRVKNVPFYLTNVAPEDVVLAEPTSEGYLRFQSVVQRGKYSVYRLLIYEQPDVQETVSRLQQLGALVDADDKLIAVGVGPETQEETVRFIISGKESGRWGAQDGYIFEDTF